MFCYFKLEEWGWFKRISYTFFFSFLSCFITGGWEGIKPVCYVFFVILFIYFGCFVFSSDSSCLALFSSGLMTVISILFRFHFHYLLCIYYRFLFCGYHEVHTYQPICIPTVSEQFYFWEQNPNKLNSCSKITCSQMFIESKDGNITNVHQLING